MSEASDLYALLGVAPSATPEEIRRAYRALVRRHHPDTRGTEASGGGRVDAAGEAVAGEAVAGEAGADEAGAGEAAAGDVALQRAVAAYAVLGDPRTRADYDRSVLRRAGQRVEVRRTPPRREARDQLQPAIRVGPVRWHHSSR